MKIINAIYHFLSIIESWVLVRVRSILLPTILKTQKLDNDFCAVITVFKRHQNLKTLLDTLEKCSFIKKIIVINANPRIALDLDINSDIDLVQSKTIKRPGYRWYVLKEYGKSFTRFIAIDDDTLILPAQLFQVAKNLERKPDRPHGIVGSKYTQKPKSFDSVSQRSITSYHKNCSMTVDVIHQLYAVTIEHLDEFHRISSELDSYKVEDPNSIGDDIIISHCGTCAPVICNVGKILECPTSHISHIAVHSEDNAAKRRCNVIDEIWTKRLSQWQ